MTDKLTDAEVKKALECVLQSNNGLDKNNAIVALDLINHKDQENESLKAEVERLKGIITNAQLDIEDMLKRNGA